MQHRAALWITGAFHILPLWGVKAIASLIPIHLHLNKIGGRHHLQMAFLPKYHTFNSLMDDHYSKKAKSHCLSMSKMIDKQQYRIKSSIIDFNNQLNKAFPTFDKLHKELSLVFKLVDNFLTCYCFYTVNWKTTEVNNTHLCFLNKIFEYYIFTKIKIL